MNVNHKHLRDVLESGSQEEVVARYCQRVPYLDADARRRLLGYRMDSQASDPIQEMIRRELPSQSDSFLALLAIIRRQLCVAEEMTQIWSIYNAFGHTPVMPFFETKVRSTLDQLPEAVLRNEHYERRVLGELATRYCPGYVPQPRQLGYGLPMGLPAYPDAYNMEEVVATFCKGPLSQEELYQLLETCKGAVGAELFQKLRRLWTGVMLHAWLELILDTYSPAGRVRTL